MRAAEKESKRLASRADKITAEIDKEEKVAARSGGVETQEKQTSVSSGKDILAVEQAILSKERGDTQVSAPRPEKKISARTKSRSKKDRIAEANKHYALGIQKWDDADINGAIEEFKKTATLNPDAAGAYYNLSLGYLKQGNKKEACNYAYEAGKCFIRIKNISEATRMAVLITKIDITSPLIQKLRNRIASATK